MRARRTRNSLQYGRAGTGRVEMAAVCLGAVMRSGRLDSDDMGEHFEKLPDDIIHHVSVVIDPEH